VTLIIAGVLALFVGVKFVVNRVRHRAAQRRDERARRLRIAVAGWLAEEDRDAGTIARLSGKEGGALDELLCSLLTKVRGEDRSRLVEVLEMRGVIDRARAGARSHRPLERARACELLGAAEDKRALFALLGMLDDHTAGVRRAAARALGGLGSSVAVPHLLARLDAERNIDVDTITMALMRFGPSPAARAVAADLLGRGDRLEVVPALISRVEFDDDERVRIAAVHALGRIGSPSCALTLLDVMGEDQSPELRTAAIRAMGDIGVPESLSVLEACMDADDHDVATAAAEAMLGAGAAGEQRLKELEAYGDRRATYAREALTGARGPTPRPNRM
jgi:HEAT repeat protein